MLPKELGGVVDSDLRFYGTENLSIVSLRDFEGYRLDITFRLIHLSPFKRSFVWISLPIKYTTPFEKLILIKTSVFHRLLYTDIQK